MFKRIATHPVKFGLALNACGYTITCPSGVASISGVKAEWIGPAMVIGLAMIAIGNFYTTLYTNGGDKTPEPPPTAPIPPKQ